MGKHQKRSSLVNHSYLVFLWFHQASLLLTLKNLGNVFYSAFKETNSVPRHSGHLEVSLKLPDQRMVGVRSDL